MGYPEMVLQEDEVSITSKRMFIDRVFHNTLRIIEMWMDLVANDSTRGKFTILSSLSW